MKKTVIKRIRADLKHPANAGYLNQLKGVNLNKVDMELLLKLHTITHYRARGDK